MKIHECDRIKAFSGTIYAFVFALAGGRRDYFVLIKIFNETSALLIRIPLE